MTPVAATLTEDQKALYESAQAFLSDRCGFERLQAVIGGGTGWDQALWRGFAGELGFAGLGVAEAHGGSGLGPVDQALVLEALGRTLAPIPYFESAVLAAAVVEAAATTAQKADLLVGIAAGDTIATLAWRDAAGVAAPEGSGATLSPMADGWRLAGEAHYVPFGHVATLLLVAAQGPHGGLSLAAVPVPQTGVTVERRTTLDLTRPYSTVRFDIVVAPSQLLGEPGATADPLRRALSVASGLLASEQLGGAARSLEETVAYAKQRVQFGRVIGSFQAVKHRLADMRVLVDAARTAAGWAAQAIASGEDAGLACAGARAYCSEAFLSCAADAIQLHGGIGFTWEHHAHLFFKRARASATLLDPPAVHRERIARTLLDPAPLEFA